jgi:hypothetical protein
VPCTDSAADHLEPTEVDATTALLADGGMSAQRMHDRLSAKREIRIRTAHPRLGGLILALSDDPTSMKVWARGAEGERRVARRLNELIAEGVIVLHDRRIPGSRANIDHIAIAPTGVHVIDSKRYQGQVELRRTGGLFRAGPDKLFVGGRDKTALLDGMAHQIAAVHAAVGDLIAEPDTMITPVLCFVDTEWGVFAKPFRIDDTLITWPKALVAQLRVPGPLTLQQIAALGEQLSSKLPAA